MKFPIKTLIAIGLCILFAATAAGMPAKPESVDKIKAVIITVDDYEDAEANSISGSVKKDYVTISQLFNILEKRNLFTVEKQVLRGKQPTKARILKAVQQVNVRNDEVLFVYFSGHGGMENGRSFVAARKGELIFRSELERKHCIKIQKFFSHDDIQEADL